MTVIRTIGQAEVNEEITFATDKQLLPGDVVELKPIKPKSAETYGRAVVLDYEGPGRKPTHRRFRARRLD